MIQVNYELNLLTDNSNVNIVLRFFCLKDMPGKYSSAMSKFRCGVAPIRIEIGLYINYFYTFYGNMF